MQKGGEWCQSSEVGQWEEDSFDKKKTKPKDTNEKKGYKKGPQRDRCHREQRDPMKKNKTMIQEGGKIIKKQVDKVRQSVKVMYGNEKELHHHQVMRMR